MDGRLALRQSAALHRVGVLKGSEAAEPGLPHQAPLNAVLRRHAPLLAAAATFSLFINLLVLASPVYMLQVYDRVLSSRSIETLALLTVIALFALAALSWLDSIRMQLLAGAAAGFESEASTLVLRQMVATPGLGDAIYRHGLRDLRSMRNFLSSAGCIALLDIPWCPAFVALITLLHPLFGAVAMAGLGSLVFLAWLDDRLSRRAVRQAAEASRHAAELAEEAMRNAEVVRVQGMHGGMERRAQRAGGRAASEFLAAGRASSRVLAVSKLLRQGLQVVMLGFGAYLVISQQASPGAMIAATILLSRAMAPIETAIAGWRSTIEARLACRRVAAFLSSAATPAPMPLPDPRGDLTVERATLVIDGVSILKGVSLALQRGELLGLIGPSGAGKSMLGRLLVGALHPTSGQVRLDGAPWPQWDAERVGRHIGYLPQDVQLFDGTVAENIARLGEPSHEHARIVDAAMLAGAHEMILRLPQGYDTQIGPHGCRLSSGQRQSIGLARAFFGDPELIVLDEPNANLDTDGEQSLLAALRALQERGATVVVITHRPLLLRDADKVLVLHAGAVAEFGEREAVLGRFARVAPITPVRAAQGG